MAYGNDEWTGRATEVLRGHFGKRSEILFALTGTGANVIPATCTIVARSSTE